MQFLGVHRERGTKEKGVFQSKSVLAELLRDSSTYIGFFKSSKLIPTCYSDLLLKKQY